MLIKFMQGNGHPVYINPKYIVSIYSKSNNQTEITTVNYNEFYIIDDTIDNVIKILEINNKSIGNYQFTNNSTTTYKL